MINIILDILSLLIDLNCFDLVQISNNSFSNINPLPKITLNDFFFALCVVSIMLIIKNDR